MIDTIDDMKHRHAIEAYKLQALKGKGKIKPPRTASLEHPADSAGAASGDPSGVRAGGKSSQAEIYRGSTINYIVSEGGFLKTGFGYRKAAKLLLLLGKDQASMVLKHLLPEEVEKISGEIAGIRQIDKNEAEKILEEFGALTVEFAARPRGGVDAARDILIATFGVEKADTVLEKISPFAGRRPFSFLNELEFQQIMLLLRKEPVHVMSIVISYLRTDKASQVLESLPPDSQALIVRRIARLGTVSPDVLSAIEESLRERIRTQGKVITEEIDGQQVLAEILKHLPLEDEDRILEFFEEQNSELAREIREKLYSIESILEIPDIQLQDILRKYPDRDIAAILKGRSEELQEKLLRNVSERRREFIRNERELLGPMKKSKVDGITRDFLAYIRAQADEGNVTLEPGDLI